MGKKVSVIIPAYNEENFIQKTIEFYKNESFPLEVIVIVNNSDDRTFEIAKLYADKVLNLSGEIGVSSARNEGAKIADGEIFIFSDADSYLEKNSIAKIVEKTGGKTVGTLLGKEDEGRFKGKIFFFFKNWIHRLRIYQGVAAGVLVCHKDIFLRTGGFDKDKKIGEFLDFIKRAKKNGADYRVFTDCYAITSMRRYEKQGYIRTLFFWMRWKFLSMLKLDKEIAEKYFESKRYE